LEELVKKYSITDINAFLDCPLKWVIKREKGKLYSKKDQAIKEIATFYLYKLMDKKYRSTAALENKVESYGKIFKHPETVKNWVVQLKELFDAEMLDVKCINFPFTLRMLGKIEVTDKIDIIRKGLFGYDIILYDFSKKFDVKELIDNPLYMIYVLAFKNNFQNDLNSINIYNLPKGELVDISRPISKMDWQLDKLQQMATDIYEFNIVPRISSKCKKCNVTSVCNIYGIHPERIKE
jgi:hypothetical protein